MAESIKREEIYSDDQKRRAAYALNLCTVSVSQIIEYRDLRFMEQEYENILNNLNLEMMPKDEALLDILKQILDVISYFRIEDGERKMLEKEYRHRAKNAIWSAIPSPSVIFSGAGAGLWGMAATLALSVGTGYMNFRKEKANIELDRERKEWELQRSALEQLHGLRRQLFETAWRLAESYGFADDLRLTERRITQYNEILLDPNPLRRYQRLSFIEDHFKAYPPFLYHQGSAALQAATAATENAITIKHIKNAERHFDAFIKLSKKENRLLREDPTVTQCVFEYIAALSMKEECGLSAEKDSGKMACRKKELLDMAYRSAGNALDALQICALNYMALGEKETAQKLLLMLVNEDYNTASNAQILSAAYVFEAIAAKKSEAGDLIACYHELEQRLPHVLLYPLPQDLRGIKPQDLDRAFCQGQRRLLLEKLIKAFELYLSQSRMRFYEIWEREDNIEADVIAFFRGMTATVGKIYPDFEEKLIDSFQKIIPQAQDSMVDFYDQRSARAKHKDISFDRIVKEPIEETVKAFAKEFNKANTFDRIMALEKALTEFCIDNNISFDSYISDKTVPDRRLENAITGKSTEEQMQTKELLKICKTNTPNLIDEKKDGFKLSFKGDLTFKNYIQKYRISDRLPEEKPIMLIEDKTKGSVRRDLLFTEKGVFLLEGQVPFVKAALISPLFLLRDPKTRELTCGAWYEDLKCDNALCIGGKEYKEKGIDYGALALLLQKIKEQVNKYQKEKENDRLRIDFAALVKTNTAEKKADIPLGRILRAASGNVEVVMHSYDKSQENAVRECIVSLTGKRQAKVQEMLDKTKFSVVVVLKTSAVNARAAKELLEKAGAVVDLNKLSAPKKK